MAAELANMFHGDLNPVAPKAQKKVQIPEGLDLDAWINTPPSSSSEDEEEDIKSGNDIFVKSSDKNLENVVIEPTEEELERVNNLLYINKFISICLMYLNIHKAILYQEFIAGIPKS